MVTARAGLVAVLLVATLSACGGDDPSASLAGTWQLTEGTGPDGEVELIDDHPITLEIAGEEWSGTAACNSYGATADVDGDAVELTELFWTEMACPADGVMASEAAYLAALQQVERIEVDDTELTLTGPGSELTFTRTQTST